MTMSKKKITVQINWNLWEKWKEYHQTCVCPNLDGSDLPSTLVDRCMDDLEQELNTAIKEYLSKFYRQF